MFTYTRHKEEKGIDMAYKVIGVQERESHGAVVSASLKRWYLGLIKRLLPQSCALTSHSFFKNIFY